MNIIFLIKVLYFMLPAYIANMAPVLFKKHFRGLAKPIDGNIKFFGKPLFGKNKTWRGLILAVLVGALVFEIQVLLRISSIVTYSEQSIFLGIFLGGGAILGDLAGSFIKRRFNVGPGKMFPVVDQFDFVIGALLLASILVDLSNLVLLIILIASPIMTIMVNHFAYYTGIRREKW